MNRNKQPRAGRTSRRRSFGQSAAALAAALVLCAAAAPAEPRTNVLVVTGRDYPGHKWRETAPVLQAALAADPRLNVTVSEDPAALRSPELGRYRAIVLHYMNWEDPGPGPEAQENLRRAVEGGTGLVLVHFACGAFQGWPEFVKLAGRVWNPKLRAHDAYGAFRVNIADAAHPITKGMEPFDTTDELYTCLAGETPIQVLATARSKVDGKDYPMAFVLDYGKGRVFHCVLGHDVAALRTAPVGALFRRGTAWAVGKPPTP